MAVASAARGGGEVGLLVKKDQVDAVPLSFFLFPAFLLRSVMGDLSHSPASRGLLS